MITVILVLAASSFVLMTFAKLKGSAMPFPDPENVGVIENAELRGARFSIGNPSRWIVEFADFQCPACARSASVLRRFVEQNREVGLVFRHLPLPSHPFAFEAAIASECAADQNRFWELHDVFFAQQSAIGSRSWASFAEEAGIENVDVFQKCMTDDGTRARIEQDTAVAMRLGAAGTPAFYFDGRIQRGLVRERELRRLTGISR
jgi:protein-disulfide isomerase